MVVQNIDYDSPGPPVIYPDMTGTDLDRSMREHTMAVGVVYGAAHVPASSATSAGGTDTASSEPSGCLSSTSSQGGSGFHVRS
jgi:hypothetical protein